MTISDMEAHDISVVVPVYNGERHVKKCLESLLNQSVRPSEIIVVDDGSTDDSARIASMLPVRIIRHGENLGLASARNTGVMEVKTDLVAFIDADCAARGDMLENMLKNYDGPDVGGVGGWGVEMYSDGLANAYRSIYSVQKRGDKKGEIDGLFGLCFSFRREAVEKAGMFDPFFKTHGEDGDMSMRVRQAGYKLIFDPDIVVYHRKESTIKSHLKAEYNSYFYGAFAHLKNVGGGPGWLGLHLATNCTSFTRRVGNDLCRLKLRFMLMDVAVYLVNTKAAIDVYSYYRKIRSA